MLKKTIILFFLVFLSLALYAQNDSIKLSNGDLLVGTVKNMSSAVLTIKTKYSNSDFHINWPQVKEFYSDRQFIIYLKEGDKIHSTIRTNPANTNEVFVSEKEKRKTIALNDIIFIDRYGQKFLKRLHAEVDAGISLRKAQNYQEFTGNVSLSYLTEKWRYSSTINMVFSTQENTDDISRYEFDLAAMRYLKNEWFLAGGLDLYSNSDQNLKLRATESAGAGYFIKNNNKFTLGTIVGLAYNNESYTNSVDPSKNSLESFFKVQASKYAVGTKFSLDGYVTASPSITERGRMRVDFNFNTKYKFTPKLYIKMGLTYNYDNQPAAGATKGDYTFQTTFGWDNN